MRLSSKYSWEVTGTRGSRQMPFGEDSAVLISVQGIDLGTNEAMFKGRITTALSPDFRSQPVHVPSAPPPPQIYGVKVAARSGNGV